MPHTSALAWKAKDITLTTEQDCLMAQLYCCVKHNKPSISSHVLVQLIIEYGDRNNMAVQICIDQCMKLGEKSQQFIEPFV